MNASKPNERNTKNVLEWVVFGISCVLVSASVGFLAIQAIQHHQDHADLRVQPGEVILRKGVAIVPIKLTNHGSVTAAEVTIEVEAAFPSGPKTAGFSVDYIPRGGTREGFVVFDEPIAPTEIRSRVAGYTEP